MEYPTYGVQDSMVVDQVPFFGQERGGFGSFPLQLGSENNLQLPMAISQWSTTDPTLLQVNDHEAWNSNTVRISQQPTSTNCNGGVCDMCVRSTSAQHVNVAAQSNNSHLIPMDTLPANNSTDPNFPVGGEIPQWMQVYFMIQERCNNDHMPQLISDSSTQHPCLYTSSSEGPHEADSSGSSGARDYSLPSSGVVGCSSEEINWRNSDVVHGNFAAASASASGFHMEELYDDTSSVSQIGHMDILDMNAQSSLGLLMQQRNAFKETPNVSWTMSNTESNSTAMVVNHCSAVDPLLNIAVLQDNGPPPYKRARLSYNSTVTVDVESSISIPNTSSNCRQTLVPSPSPYPRASSSDYPMTSLNVADALYRDIHFSSKQHQHPHMSVLQPHLQLQRSAASCVVQEISGYGSSRSVRDATTTATTTTTMDHDLRASNRKHNATSIEPQSVAARHRRKKISERVRVLEKLIPGGNKMDTASMLDEAIEYVKFLQLQVGLLEKLGELPGTATADCSMTTNHNRSSTSSYHGGSNIISRPTPTMPVRPTTSPLILSEILQQQLFKQKLCLVSLRQYPSGGSPSGSLSA